MATDGQIAAHLDLSERSVRDLKKRGVLPAAPRREMEEDACRLAYIRHLRSSAAGRGGTGPGSLEAERARLASAQAEAQERKNARERGDIMSIQAAEIAVLTLIEALTSRLRLVGAHVAGADYKLRKRIEGVVNDCLEEISALKPCDLRPDLNASDEEEDGKL